MPETEEKAKETTEVEVRFPDLQNGHGIFRDTATNRIWIGVDCEKWPDVVFAWAAVESSKLAFLCNFGAAMQDLARRKNLAVPGGILDRVNSGLKKAFTA